MQQSKTPRELSRLPWYSLNDYATANASQQPLQNFTVMKELQTCAEKKQQAHIQNKLYPVS